MSGDYGPRFIIPAALDFIKQQSHVKLILVGDTRVIEQILPADTHLLSALDIVHAEEIVAMDERPSVALRKCRKSSMYRAIDLVLQGEAQACVSAGNTGALMAMGRYLLNMHPGIDRPAITTPIPTRSGQCHMLDLGANMDCSAEQLFQFALMGSELASAIEGTVSPKVALLNVGEEENKGNEQVKLASRLIVESRQLNYIGYIEGDDIYSGRADVIVCDGFVGNVVLKSSEGLARFLGRSLDGAFKSSPYRRLLGWLARPVLAELQSLLDPSRRNGASFLGLQGIVVKSHGAANRECFRHAIEQALLEIQMDLPSKIKDRLGSVIH